MKVLRILLLVSLASLANVSRLPAVTITEIVAFGDSLTDTGNASIGSLGTFPPSPPYFDGRFSNGPVFVERLAEGLGVAAPTPSLAGGTNYAFSGALTSLSGLSPAGTPNIGTQVGLYLTDHLTLTSDQLVVIYGGANDFLFAGQTDPSVPVMNLASSITALANAGGQNFLVPNLPPLGSTPALLGTANADPLNALSVGFNTVLDAELDQLESSLGITIFRPDVYGLVQQVIADPGSFGFTNVTAPAFDESTGTVVSNPDEYFYWDTFHPTRVAHQILGDRALAAVVPEPSSLVLIAVGAVGLIPIIRQRRRRLTARTSG